MLTNDIVSFEQPGLGFSELTFVLWQYPDRWDTTFHGILVLYAILYYLLGNFL